MGWLPSLFVFDRTRLLLTVSESFVSKPLANHPRHDASGKMPAWMADPSPLSFTLPKPAATASGTSSQAASLTTSLTPAQRYRPRWNMMAFSSAPLASSHSKLKKAVVCSDERILGAGHDVRITGSTSDGKRGQVTSTNGVYAHYRKRMNNAIEQNGWRYAADKWIQRPR